MKKSIWSATVTCVAVAFSAPAGKIAFTSTRDGNAEVYVMDADGSDLVRLTNNKASDDQPAVSPDGKSVVFVSNRDGNHELYIVGIDGKGLKRLTETPYAELDPSFYPDGKSVIFTTTARGGKDLARLDLTTGKVEDVVTDDGDQFMSRVANDGALVYVEDGGDQEIIFRDAAGRKVNLSNSPGVDTMPVFSPDGKIVYFVSQRGGDYDVYAVNRDGSGVRELLATEALEGRPAPSPDGTLLVVPSDADGDLDLYLYTVAGERVSQLTTDDGDDYEPYWSQ